MSTFGLTLKKLRTSQQLTQTQLADKLGLSFSTISMYERGEREPDFETMESIADFFNVSMDYLHGKNKYKSPVIAEDVVTFPIIGEIAAGYEEIAIEDWSGETIDIPLSYLNGRKKDDYFVLTVNGDSMYTHYQDGDIVLVLKQSTLDRSGDVGAIIYDGECATLKKIEFVKGEDWLKLIPLNPEFKPKLIKGADLETCRVIGIPKLLIRKIV